jgi:hypothetical protein
MRAVAPTNAACLPLTNKDRAIRCNGNVDEAIFVLARPLLGNSSLSSAKRSKITGTTKYATATQPTMTEMRFARLDRLPTIT